MFRLIETKFNGAGARSFANRVAVVIHEVAAATEGPRRGSSKSQIPGKV